MLYFTPRAWSKLLFLRDKGDSEVGGFGITPRYSELIEDIYLPKQVCCPISVKFDDDSISDMFDSLVDEGLEPNQFGRIWIHTHPGSSAQPSNTDEKTFARVFDKTDYAIMYILAKGGQQYCRLKYNYGFCSETEIKPSVDFESEYVGTSYPDWLAEYEQSVTVTKWKLAKDTKKSNVFAAARPEVSWNNISLAKEKRIDDLAHKGGYSHEELGMLDIDELEELSDILGD